MKTVFIFFILLSTIYSAQGQEFVLGEECHQCSMPIRDPNFLARIIEVNGTSHDFDAIECLIRFLKHEDDSNLKKILVADYSQNGALIPAKQALYLKSRAIASPMGAYLSAYQHRKAVIQIQQMKGGEIYNWEELLAQFENANFGLLDHPTHHHNQPNVYAPIGVMGDHLHHKGNFMLSVRYMKMNMDGNRSEALKISDNALYQQYMIAPQEMQMSMVMLGLMYAPTDNFTIMIMQNYRSHEMDLRSNMGMNFSTAASGVGDLHLSALYGLMNRSTTSLHLNAAVSLPTGSIRKTDDTPSIEKMKLPYPMQMGSGTTDLIVGGTYKVSWSRLNWGIQQLSTFRTGENSQGYRLGDQYELNTWLGCAATTWSSLSIRMNGTISKSIVGKDLELNPLMTPPASSTNSGLKRIQSYLGVNFSLGSGTVLRNFKVGFEYGLPIYQKVIGTQMNEQSAVIFGLTYSI